MARVDDIFGRYVAACESAGRAVDPGSYLDEVGGAERDALVVLINAYLDEGVPMPEWDPAAFHGSEAEKLADRLDHALTGEAGEWPVLLPKLRHEVRKPRSAVVAELTQELGVGADAEPRIAEYYHGMESGLLPAEGVTDRVLEALGRVLGCGSGLLRRAGRRFSEAGSQPGGIVFARVSEGEQPELIPDLPPPVPARDTWDEVDRLFRGRNGE